VVVATRQVVSDLSWQLKPKNCYSNNSLFYFDNLQHYDNYLMHINIICCQPVYHHVAPLLARIKTDVASILSHSLYRVILYAI